MAKRKSNDYKTRGTYCTLIAVILSNYPVGFLRSAIEDKRFTSAALMIDTAWKSDEIRLRLFLLMTALLIEIFCEENQDRVLINDLRKTILRLHIDSDKFYLDQRIILWFVNENVDALTKELSSYFSSPPQSGGWATD